MIYSPIANGYKSTKVTVECSITNGLPSLIIVGLASKAVDEAKERLRSAIASSGFRFPKKRILINLAPADTPKNSSSLDLAMAIAILKADGQINNLNYPILCVGELGLDGSIRPVRGIIGLLRDKQVDVKECIIPCDNQKQASHFADSHNILVANNLKAVVQHFNSNSRLKSILPSDSINILDQDADYIDFNEVKGQEAAKRALLIAATGGHNILMNGPPGTGKSMLAKAFIGILPKMTTEQALETTYIHSIAGYELIDVVTMPPLRSPHHTASSVAIIGGGHSLKPGEISLAHNGVLFLDEISEFQKNTLESLRQPLEDGCINISRAQSSTTYPSNFILIATTNPCPCGYYGTQKSCNCSAQEINRHQKKFSGPIMDRIDIHIDVADVDHKNLLSETTDKTSPSLRSKVDNLRRAQIKRAGILNASLNSKNLRQKATVTDDAKIFLDQAATRLNLSARAYIKVIKVSRTIADIEGSEAVAKTHVAEALQYRPKENALL